MSENTNGKVEEEMPNTEVVAKAERKRFTAAEKLRILREVDACQGSGEIGALLRREGIYSSYLTTWRRQREDEIHQVIYTSGPDGIRVRDV
jgi:transposase